MRQRRCIRMSSAMPRDELYTELKSVAIALKKPGTWLQLKG
jgi:hypothetical protein